MLLRNLFAEVTEIANLYLKVASVVDSVTSREEAEIEVEVVVGIGVM